MSDTIQNTEWSQFLQEESELPPDVKFRVLENSDEEDMKTGHVSAHKLLLAGISPVFRKLFFGPMKNTDDVVDIKETNIEAFKTMINYVYSLPKLSLKDITCPKALCDVLNLAERYQIPGLVKKITLILQNLPITLENIMITATTAKKFTVFDEVSQMLNEKCGKFLTTKLKTSGDVYSFLQKTHLNCPEVDKDVLFDMMRANAKCTNCGMVTTKCKHGRFVRRAFRVGLKVAKVKVMNQGSEKLVHSRRFAFPLPACTGHATITNIKTQQTGIPGTSPFNVNVELTCVGHNQHTTEINLYTLLQNFCAIVFACRDPNEEIIGSVSKKRKFE